MDLARLKVFLAVYRAGGFAAVASDQGVAPSSVSRAIAALEDELGVRLFQRSTRKMEPTEAGDDLYRRMGPLLEEMDAVQESVRARSDVPHGRLRVTASVSFGQLAIAPRLTAFRRAYPEIELELVLSDARLDVLGERFDLAIRHGRLTDSTLVASRLKSVRYHLVASPAFLKALPALCGPKDIASHPCIAFGYEGLSEAWRFKRKRIVQSVPIQPIVTISNAAAIRQCTLDGLGFALLADWTIAADLEAGTLVDALPEWEGAGSSFDSAIWLVFPSGRYVPAKARAFADFLRG